jgi:hypothetical protein
MIVLPCIVQVKLIGYKAASYMPTRFHEDPGAK